MNTATKRRLVLLPVGFTLALVAWTALVYRKSAYGPWHIYPALAVVPLVLVSNVGLIIWGACLMAISKDLL